MGFMAPLMVAGLAASAAGSGLNFMEKKKTAKDIARINREARGRIDANTAAATGRWNESLAKLTPEEQERLTAESAGKREAQYDAATADVPSATNVMGATEGAPAIVRTEAAKQLGDKLGQMRGMMQAKSRLSGWDDRGLATSTLLGRSREDIARLGNFSQGWSSAAEEDAARRAQRHSPLGDILTGAGALMMGGAGAAGAGTGALGATNVVGPGGPTAWQSAALPLNTKWDLYGPPAPRM